MRAYVCPEGKARLYMSGMMLYIGASSLDVTDPPDKSGSVAGRAWDGLETLWFSKREAKTLTFVVNLSRHVVV